MNSMHLHHGRKVIQDMDGKTGISGPDLGPIDTIEGMYEEIEVKQGGRWITLETYQDLIYYDGIFYGGWIIHESAYPQPMEVDKASCQEMRIDLDLVVPVLGSGGTTSCESYIRHDGDIPVEAIQKEFGLVCDGWEMVDDGIVRLEAA